ncbi:acyl-CoA dehydrogenase family protein [Teichococcus oryzae]|uniref:Uncharacterized protein n=1 Tax=Teichococcus oryzae TaxID=1608942 RepID=A0A5B2TAC6_9PROT|nr:hypothetical protein [Pseudoroseomonas oryzae]KAA2211189.1 hypothetical protein F0Q34_21430 [Pseudoroseomonas oryzae]
MTDYLKVVEEVSRVDGTVGWCVTIGGGAPPWLVGGLRGTGSHDYRVTDLFVPASHAVALGQEPVQPSPLYALPPHTVLGLTIAAVPLGIARTALDAVREISASKTPRIRSELLDTSNYPLLHGLCVQDGRLRP